MAQSDVGKWAATLEGFTKESFEAEGKRRDIYRAGTGPAVLVIAEMPGITPGVADFARRVVASGCTAIMPHLFGDDGRPASAGYLFKSIGPACVSKEFSALALKKTSPVTVWLRKLGQAEHERCGGPGIGVVGMCFTGGFALAMMVDDFVLAPVLSQPSLPFPINKKYKADIGISDADLAKVKERTAEEPASWACASATTPSASRLASTPSGASWATPSSPSSWTRPRVTRTITPSRPTRC